MGFFLRKTWLWWLLAALLAWFITWLICRMRGRGVDSTDSAVAAAKESELREARRLVDTHKKKVTELEAELARRPKAMPPLDLAAAGAVIGHQVKMDDLEVVEGIGPKIAELLHQNGINSWTELARADTGHLRTILDGAGPNYRIAEPASWPHQASLLANGRWTEFKILTDELDAGRYGNAGGPSTSGATATGLMAEAGPSAEQLRTGGAALGIKLQLDDLKVVEGIGPAIERLLQAGGIKTWRQLSTTPTTRLQEILDAAGNRFQVHNPGTWPRQAGLLADAKWAEFKTLTDELKGGRET